MRDEARRRHTSEQGKKETNEDLGGGGSSVCGGGGGGGACTRWWSRASALAVGAASGGMRGCSCSRPPLAWRWHVLAWLEAVVAAAAVGDGLDRGRVARPRSVHLVGRRCNDAPPSWPGLAPTRPGSSCHASAAR